MKVKIEKVNKKDLEETNKIMLNKAKNLYSAQPFVTKVWLAMRGFPMEWVVKNWNAITESK